MDTHTARPLLALAIAALGMTGSAVALGASASAAESEPFVATFVEKDFTTRCAPGTSCGFGSIAGIGHVPSVTVQFDACGAGCQVRTLSFGDGSTLTIQEVAQHWFVPRGNSGDHANAAPAWLPLDVTIVGGTGRFADASGTATGTVRTTNDDAHITMSGTWSY
ncbi:MAG TPA: hypothetical protein VK045_01370 [Ornithinicoccus sp.]|nr:hypothetical protein [Ornithinicoccus sp.]